VLGFDNLKSGIAGIAADASGEPSTPAHRIARTLDPLH
jgi:hypothetical protein